VATKSPKSAATKVSGKPKKAVTSHKLKASGSKNSKSDVPRRATTPKVARKASATLRASRSSSSSKSLAGSALSQVQNPRSGRFVIVDRTSGSIISHKKSLGAYKGISISKKVSKKK
jgi:hypothetical protein